MGFKWIDGLAKEANQHIQATTQELAEIYSELYINLTEAITQEKLTSYQNGQALGKLKHIEAALTEANARLAKYTQELVERSYGMGSGWVDRNLQELGLHSPPPMTKFMKSHVKILTQDTFTHLAGRTENMKEGAVAHLRKQAAEAFREGHVGGITSRQVIKDLVNRLKNDPEFEFVDKAKRKWTPEAYADMVVQTVHANVHREAKIDRLTQRGHEVAQITATGTKHAGCAAWEGRRVALTPEASAKHGLPYIQDIRGNDIFHPRCHHSVVITPELQREVNQVRKERKLARKKRSESLRAKIAERSENQVMDSMEIGEYRESTSHT